MNLDLNDEVNYGEAEKVQYEQIKNMDDGDVCINAKEFNLAKQQQTSSRQAISPR